MGIVNRRNAVLGWGVWKVTKGFAKMKAKNAAPSVDGGKPNRSAIALGAASAIGVLAFWRSRRTAED
jgi:hypothetical protein